ncbi:nuclear transport factor 2 family protein [Aeromicrobium sp. 9AM]|uniref:nuclear transport factor 2 family protein n=1 Tax=Aeromicrobium sp. 9AM TaxID=2653126 RepID=UPI0012F265A0|nr:nuclear transport factor 2 family protein [Aeromicrobium sp. 9AM]VXB07166.1 conserved hypothetical protein [Aeromicrobium sp. 9AM]
MRIDLARQFADSWVTAWNSHDLEGVLSHFADDAVFSSPVAAQLMPNTAGILRGKEAIREYWSNGLTLIPDLRFEIQHVFVGLETVVITYRNQADRLVSEVLHFNDEGIVTSGAGTYLTDDAATATGASAR